MIGATYATPNAGVMLMPSWSNLSNKELERRRAASISVMTEREKEKFAAWYQQQCDADYWSNGQRCSGCDFWESEGGMIGACSAVGVVSGSDVMRSMGIRWSTYIPEPGFPITRSDFWCGRFKDDFDWSALDNDYLHQIGAMKNGVLRDQPKAANTPPSQDKDQN